MVSNERIDLIFVNIRRFLARILDIAFYKLLCDFVMYSVMGLMLLENWWEQAMINCFPFVVMIFVEPLFLHFFGTTLGKFIFGIYIHTSNGIKLTYEEGLERTWKVFVFGQGLQLPIISLLCYIRSYIVAKRNEYLSWEAGSVLEIKDRKLWIQIIAFLTIGVVSFASTCVQKSAILPNNRGVNITKQEIVENYESYLYYYEITDAPELEIKEKDGKITQVKLELIQENEQMSVKPFYDYEQVVANCAFAAYVGAQREISVFNWYKESIMYLCNYSVYEDNFQFEKAGVLIKADIEKEGYVETYEELLSEEGEQQSYHLIFTMEPINKE